MEKTGGDLVQKQKEMQGWNYGMKKTNKTKVFSLDISSKIKSGEEGK